MAKTKAQISFAVTAKLICVFVFAYADCWFSHAVAHILFSARMVSPKQIVLFGIPTCVFISACLIIMYMDVELPAMLRKLSVIQDNSDGINSILLNATKLDTGRVTFPKTKRKKDEQWP